MFGKLRKRVAALELEVHILKNPPAFKVGDNVSINYAYSSGYYGYVSNTVQQGEGIIIRLLPPERKGYGYMYEIYDDTNKSVSYWPKNNLTLK